MLENNFTNTALSLVTSVIMRVTAIYHLKLLKQPALDPFVKVIFAHE